MTQTQLSATGNGLLNTATTAPPVTKPPTVKPAAMRPLVIEIPKRLAQDAGFSDGQPGAEFAGSVAGSVARNIAGSAQNGIAEDTAEDERKKRKRFILILILIACIVAALLLLQQCGVFRFPWEREASPVVAGDLFPGQGDAQAGHLSNMTPDEVREQMQKAADASYFSFKINARPEFENGQAAGALGIENPSYNVYPMVVQIFSDDTGEMIYDSGGILPDQHIDTARLLVALPQGEHKATAYLNAYDPTTKEWLGKQAAALVITVHN